MIEITKNFQSLSFSNVSENFRDKLDLLEGHSSKINSGLITYDNKLILTAGGSGTFGDRDNKVRVWSVDEKRQVRILKRHTSKVTTIETTFDYKFVFSGDIQGKIIVWNYENENIVNQKQMSASISLLKFDRVWSRVLTLVKGLEVVIWSFNDDNASMVEIAKIPKIVNSFFILKNSEYFLLEEQRLYISIYKMETNEFMREFQLYGTVSSNFIITDDTLNGYFGSNSEVIQWLTIDNQSKKIYEHKYSVKLLDVSNDQKKLVSCTIFSINIWDINNNCLLQMVDYVGKVINVSFDFNNFLTSQGKSICLFNIGENKHKNLFNIHKGVILNAFSSPDNSKIITLGLDSTVRTWNTENLKPINQVYLSEKFFTDIRLFQSKKYYLATCKSYTMIMKFSNLLESTTKYDEELPKDPGMSENFISDEWSKEAYEGMMSFKF